MADCSSVRSEAELSSTRCSRAACSAATLESTCVVAASASTPRSCSTLASSAVSFAPSLSRFASTSDIPCCAAATSSLREAFTLSAHRCSALSWRNWAVRISSTLCSAASASVSELTTSAATWALSAAALLRNPSRAASAFRLRLPESSAVTSRTADETSVLIAARSVSCTDAISARTAASVEMALDMFPERANARAAEMAFSRDASRFKSASAAACSALLLSWSVCMLSNFPCRASCSDETVCASDVASPIARATADARRDASASPSDTRRAVNDALTPARSAAFFAATACMFAASEALSRAAEAVRPALVLATLVRAASNFSPAHVFNALARASRAVALVSILSWISLRSDESSVARRALAASSDANAAEIRPSARDSLRPASDLSDSNSARSRPISASCWALFSLCDARSTAILSVSAPVLAESVSFTPAIFACSAPVATPSFPRMSALSAARFVESVWYRSDTAEESRDWTLVLSRSCAAAAASSAATRPAKCCCSAASSALTDASTPRTSASSLASDTETFFSTPCACARTASAPFIASACKSPTRCCSAATCVAMCARTFLRSSSSSTVRVPTRPRTPTSPVSV
mmetsp:Transcript_66630/g.158020  ORF Transcript_66630/g.158020 Transcript_66630/m.158020 type:complete len:590 (-) Transcript_66630:637-2406(-)